MNIQKMMRQAQKMQEDLAAEEIKVAVAGGRVEVTANGAGEVTQIVIAPELIEMGDAEMVQDAVLTGVQEALTKSREHQAKQMAKITGGLGGIPGLG
ncbi:MAG: YbaB/EbfC family nucleoid-associated protein [Verrucomicrobiales bacterium]